MKKEIHLIVIGLVEGTINILKDVFKTSFGILFSEGFLKCMLGFIFTMILLEFFFGTVVMRLYSY